MLHEDASMVNSDHVTDDLPEAYTDTQETTLLLASKQQGRSMNCLLHQTGKSELANLILKEQLRYPEFVICFLAKIAFPKPDPA